MVERHGIEGRSGKQCRERWRNNLDPGVCKAPWTDEEQRILEEAHARLGNCWVKIAKLLPGRTDNCVKNRFYGSVRKTMRAKQKPGAQESPQIPVEETASEETVASPQGLGVKRGHSGFTPTRDIQHPRKLKILSPKPMISGPEAMTPSQYELRQAVRWRAGDPKVT